MSKTLTDKPKHNLTIGQTIYWVSSKYIDRERVTKIKESKIATIGHKFFTLEDSRSKFSILEMRRYDSQFNQNEYRVYTSIQEIEDEREKGELIGFLHTMFSGNNRSKLSLDQLRRIKQIIDEK